MSVSLLSGSERSSILGSQDELPSLDEDEVILSPLKDPAPIKRVKFPSKRPSLESMRAISRLSSRALSEIHAVWGDEEEERIRKEKLRKDLDRIAKGTLGRKYDDDNDDDSDDDDDESAADTLGLEDKIGDRAEEKLQRREKAWDVVMWEQHNQWEELNDCNYDLVAKVYSEGAATSEVQRKAQEEAKRLEEEIEDVRNDPEVIDLLSRSAHSTLSMSSRSSFLRSCLSSNSSLLRPGLAREMSQLSFSSHSSLY